MKKIKQNIRERASDMNVATPFVRYKMSPYRRYVVLYYT